MSAFLLRRVGATVTTLWIAVTLAFFALRLLPGDAVAAQLARNGATAAQIAERRAALGLDQPVWVQYVSFMMATLRLDLGVSLATGRPVSDTIGEQIGSTNKLAVGALVFAVIVGVGLGILGALGQPAPLRAAAAFLVNVLLASPVYWVATLAIYSLSVGLRWLPFTGGDDIPHLLLPWLSLGLSMAGGIARVTMGALAESSAADFVRTARSKGLPERLVILRHMVRASLAPIISTMALQTGFLLGGAVVTETLFVRRGLGQVLLNAIQNRDYPVVQGIVMLSAVAYSIVNLLADVLISAIDPRVQATAAGTEAKS